MRLRSATRRARARVVAASLALCASLSLVIAGGGCGIASAIGPTTCDRSEKANPPIRYTEGTVEGGVYMSSAWDGELLYFPGGMRYQIEHKLGGAPRSWEFYLSFDQFGTKTGVVTPAAGNQAELRGIDDQTLTVVNGSCVEYWLLVVASGAAEGGEGGGGGGGGEGGGGG